MSTDTTQELEEIQEVSIRDGYMKIDVSNTEIVTTDVYSYYG